MSADDDDNKLIAATAAVRKYVDASGYGGYISDEKCRELAAAVIAALSDEESP